MRRQTTNLSSSGAVNLGDRLLQQFLHSSPNLMIRDRDAFSVEVAPYPREYSVIVICKFSHDQFLGIRNGIATCKCEFRCGPLSEHSVSASNGFEPKLLVVSKFPLIPFLAFFKDIGHSFPPY